MMSASLIKLYHYTKEKKIHQTETVCFTQSIHRTCTLLVNIAYIVHSFSLEGFGRRNGLLLLCIYTQRNISIYYRTQSAI